MGENCITEKNVSNVNSWTVSNSKLLLVVTVFFLKQRCLFAIHVHMVMHHMSVRVTLHRGMKTVRAKTVYNCYANIVCQN